MSRGQQRGKGMKTKNFLALDMGAGSGRGILGKFDGNKLDVEEIYRFDHHMCRINGRVYWDVQELYRQSMYALTKTARQGICLDGIGVDTWGLDYGLLDKNGNLLNSVISYRNSTEAEAQKALSKVSARELFDRTGVAHLVFNTAYQLHSRALEQDPALSVADKLLFLPDLLAYFLSGEMGTEYTIACTSMLLDCQTGTWAWDIIQKLSIPEKIFTQVQRSGTLRGHLTPHVSSKTGLGKVPVFAVASHDTASAIASIPATTDHFAYISSGTWSLIGTENDKPILSQKAYEVGYSNEGTLQGSHRLNQTIMGLGLIQECRRVWNADGRNLSWDDIVAAAGAAKPFQAFIDTDDVLFFDFHHIADKVQAYCSARGQNPETVGEIARCIYESLAMKYRYSLEQLEYVSGKKFSVIHIVGGGSKNALLNQFTANATGLPVIAGPAEGSSLANILTQAMATGEIHGIGQLRNVVLNSVDTRIYEPKDTSAWDQAYSDFLRICKPK